MSDQSKKSQHQLYLENKPRPPKKTKSSGPLRFKVRVKPKAEPTHNEAGPSRSTIAQKAPSSKIAAKIIEHVGATDQPEIAAKYEALCGAARPVSKAIASDIMAMNELKNSIATDLRNELSANPRAIGIRVDRLGVLNGATPKISIEEVKKGGKVYSKAKVDGFSAIRFCPAPKADSSEPGTAVDLVTLLIDKEADRLVYASTYRSRARDAFNRSPILWWEPDDPRAIDEALSIMFSSPFNQLPLKDPTLDGKAQFDGVNGSGHRAFLTLMFRSQLQLGKMMVGYGIGKALIKRALTSVEGFMGKRCKAAPEILNDEEILHFFFAELRRLELDHVSVPIVRLH